MSPFPKQRPFILDPGGGLLVSDDVIQFGTAYEQFARITGIPAEYLTVDPTSTIPFPVYPEKFDGDARRWPGVNPQVMWHPLMWLPAELYAR